MRNVRIEEVMNGWKVFVPSDGGKGGYILTGVLVTRDTSKEEYVFTDWNEMMEFIADYFAEEEE